MITINQLKELEELFSFEKPQHIITTLQQARERLIYYTLSDTDLCGPQHDLVSQIAIIDKIAQVLKAFDKQ